MKTSNQKMKNHNSTKNKYFHVQSNILKKIWNAQKNKCCRKTYRLEQLF